MSPEKKTEFLSRDLKIDQSIAGIVLPYNIDIFNEFVQPLFSLLSQVLGLDDDRLISEVMLGFLVKFCQSEKQI